MDLYDGATASTTRDAIPAAVLAGFFSSGVPGTKPRTVLEGWYMQILVDELMAVITAGGITPGRAVTTNVRDAINALIGAGLLTPFLSHASASTCDIGAAVTGLTSPNAVITGTTQINSLGSSASASRPFYITRFAGSLTLNHNATSLILSGGGNIVTQANDYAFWEYLGSGNWRMIAYFRADATGPQMPQTRVVVKIDGATGAQSNKVDPSGYLSAGSVRTAAGTYHLAHSSTGWPANAYCVFCLHDSSNKAGVSFQLNNTALLEIGTYDTTVATALDVSFTVEIKW